MGCDSLITISTLPWGIFFVWVIVGSVGGSRPIYHKAFGDVCLSVSFSRLCSLHQFERWVKDEEEKQGTCNARETFLAFPVGKGAETSMTN